MKIIRVSDTTTYLWELSQKLLDKNIQEGDRFGISWKVGKRRKLKAYHLDVFRGDHCECCGHYTTLVLRKGAVSKSYDNHLGLSGMSMF
jgi:hypothetical protein